MKSISIKMPVKLCMTFLVLSFIIVGCENETNVTDGIREVNFKATADKLSITEGQTITYIDSSLNVTSRTWSFEGGDISSSDQETVSVGYAEPSLGEDGLLSTGFLTELEITNADGTIESNGFNVKVFPAIVPDFVASTNAAVFGSTIDFTDNTLAAISESEEAKQDDTILWEFEGGIPATSTQRNPSVSYPEAGNFSVKLTVKRSFPESSGTTRREDFIEILLTPPCDNSVNLLGCNNFSAEEEGLSEWEAVDNTEADKSGNLSISTERATEGVASYRYLYDEPGQPAFTNNSLRFVNAAFTVTEEGSYTISLDSYGDILSMGNMDYVYEISVPIVGTTDDAATKQFYRTTGGAWFNASNTKTLAPGDYYVQIKFWNPGFDANLNYYLFIDNISVIRN